MIYLRSIIDIIADDQSKTSQSLCHTVQMHRLYTRFKGISLSPFNEIANVVEVSLSILRMYYPIRNKLKHVVSKGKRNASSSSIWP